jgi:hypothetical protein
MELFTLMEVFAMKRILMLLLGLLVFAVSGVAFANYPMYLNGDRNFIRCDGHMGTAWYVDRSSLVVQEYEPPQYIIAVDVVTARSAVGNEDDFYSGGSGMVTDVRTMRFLYDWDACAMYAWNDAEMDWYYLPPTGSWAETGISMPAGEIAFALAYRMKFYGRRSQYYEYLDRSVAIYEDAFYARIP